ncbi:unnamed protein product [Malus baccata var. baccata]
MLLNASSASSPSLARGDSFGPLFSSAPPSSPSSVSYSFSPLNSSTSMSSILRFSPARYGSGVVVCASKNANDRPLTGVVFEPFEEVKKELDLVPSLPQVSLARQKFTDESEAAINEQINVEYTVSYIYHAMYAYFDRDNVARKGLAKFFKESSEEERDHAEKLMEYQNKRGGRVKLQSILMPVSEFDHPEKGDALYAMELALSLEKLTNEKLLHLQSVAVKNKDPQLTDFVETEFLAEQVEAIKKISEYVAQIRRGCGTSTRRCSTGMLLLRDDEFVAVESGVMLSGALIVAVYRIMLLKASSASSRSLARGDSFGSLFSSAPPSSPPSVSYSFSPLTSTSVSSVLRFSPARNESGVVVCASKNANNRPLTGVVFEPFEEVKKELDLVPSLPQVSLARQKFTDESEAAINEQINVEYNVSYIYHAMYAYFDRDNVALKGLAKFFKESSEEERDHAEKLMEYQNKRGGRVKLQSILMPVSEFEHPEKGDALYAMELALSLEKLTNEKLLHLHSVAVKNKDPQLTDFVETEYLAEQVEAIKKISEYVAQLRRGFGTSIRRCSTGMLLLRDDELVAVESGVMLSGALIVAVYRFWLRG